MLFCLLVSYSPLASPLARVIEANPSRRRASYCIDQCHNATNDFALRDLGQHKLSRGALVGALYSCTSRQ